jgi:PIN domain nuclease of toxin-antitoxin system
MIVLDASALLAFLFAEPGHEQVGAALPGACLSAVNFSEVLGRFARDGHDTTLVSQRIRALGMEIVAFDGDAAAAAAALRTMTDRLGLSLGDRACLALAVARGIPALTADRAWSRLRLPVDIRVIR